MTEGVSLGLEVISNKIYQIRQKRVMIDRDLAKFYGVETKYLKRQVRRNIKRFPEEFMFELTKNEFENWRCQFVTSNADKKGLRYKPLVFTEYGILMLSSILKSERAINVNIQIIQAFIDLKKLINSSEELYRKVIDLEEKYDARFIEIYKLLSKIEEVETEERIGFKLGH